MINVRLLQAFKLLGSRDGHPEMDRSLYQLHASLPEVNRQFRSVTNAYQKGMRSEGNVLEIANDDAEESVRPAPSTFE